MNYLYYRGGECEPAAGIEPTVSSLPMTCFATKLCWHIGRIEDVG